MKLIKSIKLSYKFHHLIFLSIVLFISLLVRVANFDYQNLEYNEDTFRDYLVANHIVQFKEFPLTGPDNTFRPELKNSPVYYYFLGSILTIKNDFLFLALINILIQILTILLIYMIADFIFGKYTALIAAILFSFSQISISQSIFSFWQPWIMQPFVLLSFLFLLVSYKKGSFRLLSFSIVCICIATALYYPAFTLVPIFILLVTYVLKRQKKNTIYFVAAFEVLIYSLLLLYSPLLIYLFKHQIPIFPLVGGKGIIPFEDFLGELFNLLIIFLDNYFFNLGTDYLSVNNIVILFILCIFLHTIFLSKNKIRRNYYLILSSLIIMPLIASSLLQLNRPPQDISTHSVFGPIRHFITSYSFLAILIADLVNPVLTKSRILKFGKMLIIIALIYISPALNSYLTNTSKNIFRKWEMQSPSVDSIFKTWNSIKKDPQFKEFNNFQIRFYRGNLNMAFDNPYFWVLLEKKLNIKLTAVSNTSHQSFVQIGNSKIIYLICSRYPTKILEKEKCIIDFLEQNEGYHIIKNIYNQAPYSIYLTVRVKN